MTAGTWETVRLSAAEWAERAPEWRAGGWLVTDLCGVDRLGLPGDGPRFEVVVQLLHLERKERITVYVAAEGEPPTIPSVTGVWGTANFLEREAYDMFGIVFDGHPNLTRILMPDEWEGYPLRKDYGVGKVQVEFVAQPFLQIDTPGQAPSPERAGAGVDLLGQVTRDEP